MENRLYSWLTEKFPQNYLIKYPFRGAIILTLTSYLFILLYHPLGYHGNDTFSFKQLMGLYSITGGLTCYLSVQLLKTVPYFKNKKEWTFIKEILAILFILTAIGIGVYAGTFIFDRPTALWTFNQFFDSEKNAFMIGNIPFLFSLIINLSHIIRHNGKKYDYSAGSDIIEPAEETIKIESKLKKETLEFYPSQFLYAESDGNYVVFSLLVENQIRKEIIRNSISQIEKQLSGQPLLFRTHRSFIVNLEKITKKEGNTSGYRLRLEGISNEIPVSRQNVTRFDEIFQSLG
jgi:hypothetical protein